MTLFAIKLKHFQLLHFIKKYHWEKIITKGDDTVKKTVFLFILILFLLLFTLSVNANCNEYNWFCVHRKDHLQPVADPTISFIENYGGYYIDKKHGDGNDDKVIYLTFDAGYENGNVKRIVDVLDSEGVKGAFFVLGHFIDANSDLVQQMFDSGHLVCNHTFSHKKMTGKTAEEFKEELSSLETICLEKTGRNLSKYYRPPEGKFDEQSLKYAQDLGYKTVFWSFAYADWDNNAQLSAEKAKQKILENVHNGEIMLLHPTSATNAEILAEIIRELKEQGYRFGTLDEL
ncbi:MAG: delta-lactam-biosynthetic de-N-acetylase [Ruminococcaceae bacterium]|nr:delta-lactam-biosynthetic de-N-acetylase [Oscillospiraceae bacterium]